MATRARSSGGGAQAGRPAQPTTTETLVEVERLLLAKKPWPAFLLAGSDALDEWEHCPHVAKDALEWMTTSAVGVLDIASVGPLTPVCKAFKALIEAARGAAAAQEKLRELISWCSFIISVFIKLGKTGGALSGTPVRKCLQDFETTVNQLAKRVKTLATRRRVIALLFHRDTPEIASFENKLRKIWADIGGLGTLDVREIQRGLLPVKLKSMADVPLEALSLPDSHVERTCMVEEVVQSLTPCAAGSPPHMLVGMGGGGKTVLASAVVRHEDTLKHFRQGIFWIRVGQGGKEQMHALFQGLATKVGAVPTDTPHGIPSDGFNSLAAIVEHLSAVTATSSLPRLVVLDDVWEREVVDTLLPTGLVLLVATRDASVVGGPGTTRTDVGDMTEDESLMLLRRASSSVGSPGPDVQAAINQVAHDCGFLPLALAIAGSLPVVKGSGSSTEAWNQLHEDLQNKGDMLLAKGGANTSLSRVLDASFDELGTKKQSMFLRMAVLPKGAVTPEDMLRNLWEVEDVQELRSEAQDLMGRSLLQAAGSRGYRMHDLLLDFARDRIKSVPLESAAKRQAQYLGRLDVARGYAGKGETCEGFYSLMALWRSVEDISGNSLLQIEAYRASLLVLVENEAPDAAYTYGALGKLCQLQGKYEEAERLLSRAAVIEATNLGPGHPNVAPRLSNLAESYQAQGKYEEAKPLFLGVINRVERTMGPDHPSTATALNNLAGLLEAQGKYGEAEPLYRRSMDIMGKARGADQKSTAIQLSNMACFLKAQGKYKEAEPLFLRSIEISENTVGPDHPATAVPLKQLANVFQEQGKYAEAETLFQRALGINEKALGPDHPSTAQSLVQLAGLYTRQGKYAKAEPLILRAMDIEEKTLGPDHHNVATTLINLACVFQGQGKYSEAEPLYLRAVGIEEKSLGPDHPTTAITLNNLAMLCKAQGKHAEAKNFYLRSIDIKEKTLGPDHPSTAVSLTNLAGLFLAEGKYAEAEPLLVRGATIERKALGPDHHQFATTLDNLAVVLMAQAKYSLAEAVFLQAIDIEEKTLGSEHPSMAVSLYNLASLFKKQGKYSEAEPLLLRAIAVEEKTLGADHETVAATLFDLACLFTVQGKPNEAIEIFERVLTTRTRKLGAEHADTVNTRQALELARQQVGK